MDAITDESVVEIRKLRKKLRQIENLERLERELSDDETLKVMQQVYKKFKIRQSLLVLISEQPSIGETTTSRDDSMYNSWSSGEPDQSMSDYHDVDAEISDSSSPPDICTGQAGFDGEDNESNIAESVAKRKIHDSHTAESDLGDVGVTASTGGEEQVPPSPAKKTKTEKAALSDEIQKLRLLRQKWKQAEFKVQQLDGHSELVTGTDTDGSMLVTSSRDTTVRLWDLATGEEMRILGGHTESVTCVMLLTQGQTDQLRAALSLDESTKLIVSGSMDCSYKIWSSTTGQALQSVYTYNPVSKVAYFENQKWILTGSGGGKLDLWDIESKENIQSLHAQEDAITAMKVWGNRVVSSAACGVLKIHELRDKALCCIYVSEDLKTNLGTHITPRSVHTLDVFSDQIYYGDDGINLKVLNWRQGTAHKLTNNIEEFGTSDAVCCYSDLLVACGYDLDNGLSYLNVRSLPKETYLGTLDDEDTGRIMSISCATSSHEDLIIITGGMELKVWTMVKPMDRPLEDEGIDDDIIGTKYISQLAQTGQDTDTESDWSDNEDEPGGLNDRRRSSADSQNSKGGWFSWCELL